MYADDDLLPISGLQHLAFCPRQCALIHLERLWSENFLTASGRFLHEKTHSNISETRGGIRTVRGLLLQSRRLGLFGVADVVEFHKTSSAASESQKEPLSSFISLPGRRGLWQVYPVEYKRGRPKTHDADAVQLCAQALCLEEALNCHISEGALFYGQARRRAVVTFDCNLRAETERLAHDFHSLIDSQVTPPPVYDDRKCKACSLKEDCRPKLDRDAMSYWLKSLTDQSDETGNAS